MSRTNDDKGEVSDEDVIFSYIALYNPANHVFDKREDWQFHMNPKKDHEFLTYFAETLNEVATEIGATQMDFLSGPEEISGWFGTKAFERESSTWRRILSKVLKGSEKG